jgi:hypothetical protein
MSGNVISIRNNFPKVAAALDRLAVNVGNKVMARAMNHTIDQGKAEMARQISKEFRLTVHQAKERLRVSKVATRGRGLKFQVILEATNRGKGRSMNLIHFVTSTPTRNKKGKLGQLKFQIKRLGGRKMLAGAFVGNKGRTVFMRTSKGRLPINAVNTIDVTQMFNSKRINGAVKDVMLRRFDANFRRELRAVLRGFAK